MLLKQSFQGYILNPGSSFKTSLVKKYQKAGCG